VTRGPKRKSGKRENNGRLSRKPSDALKRVLETVDAEDREALAVGLEARVRVHGVRPEDARDQMAGSFIGRLCMQRVISRQQYEAAIIWTEDVQNYRKAVSAAQGREPGAVNLNATKGRNEYENEAFVLRSRARYKAATSAVQDKQNELRGSAHLFGALETCVMRDVAIEVMVGDLRTALNALAKHYGLMGQRRAA
jgi:hypothetical protein